MKMLQKHNCANILKYIDSYEDTQNKYIVTELCQQQTLFDKLQIHHHFNENDALYYFFQIKDAIYWMHYSKIAHRDLKLPNILFGLDNKIKLADFGFSKESQEDEFKSILGTMTTVAPEVLLNEGYSQQADIFSLGQILSKMLFGVYLFSIQDFIQKLQYLQDFIDNNLLDNCKKFKISQHTYNLLSQMLKVNPSERINIVQINQRYPLGYYKELIQQEQQQNYLQNSSVSKKQLGQQQINQVIRKNSSQIFNSQSSFNRKQNNSKAISQSQNVSQQTQKQQLSQYQKKLEQKSEVLKNNYLKNPVISHKKETQSFVQQQSSQTKNLQFQNTTYKIKVNSQKQENYIPENKQVQNNPKYTKVLTVKKINTLNQQNDILIKSNIKTPQDELSKISNKTVTITKVSKVQKLDEAEFQKQNEICQQKLKEKQEFSNLLDYMECLRSLYANFLQGLQINHINLILLDKHPINQDFQDLTSNEFYKQQKNKLEKLKKELNKNCQKTDLKQLQSTIDQEIQDYCSQRELIRQYEAESSGNEEKQPLNQNEADLQSVPAQNQQIEQAQQAQEISGQRKKQTALQSSVQTALNRLKFCISFTMFLDVIGAELLCGLTQVCYFNGIESPKFLSQSLLLFMALTIIFLVIAYKFISVLSKDWIKILKFLLFFWAITLVVFAIASFAYAFSSDQQKNFTNSYENFSQITKQYYLKKCPNSTNNDINDSCLQDRYKQNVVLIAIFHLVTGVLILIIFALLINLEVPDNFRPVSTSIRLGHEKQFIIIDSRYTKVNNKKKQENVEAESNIPSKQDIEDPKINQPEYNLQNINDDPDKRPFGHLRKPY
ncbi:hypothetical protein ABPG74_016320 [Tetrahymena malaccensis]